LTSTKQVSTSTSTHHELGVSADLTSPTAQVNLAKEENKNFSNCGWS